MEAGSQTVTCNGDANHTNSTCTGTIKAVYTWKINDTDNDCVSAGERYCTGFSEGLMYPTSCGYSYLVDDSPANYGTVQTNRTIGGACTTNGQMGFATSGTRSYNCSYCSNACHRISINGSSG